MSKFIILFLFLNILFNSNLNASNHNFSLWIQNFKKEAVANGISSKVVNELMDNAKFLPKVIEYDRFQPEFYEDTFTYIKKRSSKKKIKQGIFLYKKEKQIIDDVEKEFKVEKGLVPGFLGASKILGTDHSWSDDMLDTLETRDVWSRYGL